ncbi:MAG TPA: hypothetical protein VHF08_07190 [Nitrososphaeraceae archaeon]|nr:hypothetical protein [Nitrososphaeraceae archaeon]
MRSQPHHRPTQTFFPADREAIMSQFRVWPFPSATIMTCGERNRNPGHHFAGINIISPIYLNNSYKRQKQKLLEHHGKDLRAVN